MPYVRYQRPSPAPRCLPSPRNCPRRAAAARSADRTPGAGCTCLPKPKSLPNRNRSDSALNRPCRGPNLSKMRGYILHSTTGCTMTPREGHLLPSRLSSGRLRWPINRLGVIGSTLQQSHSQDVGLCTGILALRLLAKPCSRWLSWRLP